MRTDPMRGLLTWASLATTFTCAAQNGTVQATGAMRHAIREGRASAVVRLDTLARPGMYGVGPLEDLRGELLLLDGHGYTATANPDGTLGVTERGDVGAPFFAHQHVTRWDTVALPDTVTHLAALDAFLTSRYGGPGKAFAFRMVGRFAAVDVHVLNVPPGTAVKSRDEAHSWDVRAAVKDRAMTALGFFSTQHHGVFTHHDSNIHVHAISAERDWMGHVENLHFSPASVVFLIALP
jgi:acetolactate decarboxylase